MYTLPERYCIDLNNYDRIPSRAVNVGGTIIGALNPIRLQSMTNIPIENINANIEQCKRIFDAGADFVRISVPQQKDIEHLKTIKTQLSRDGYKKPLIADVHYNASIAEEAARVVEKVRINPGNYIDKKKIIKYNPNDYNIELEKIHNKILPLINICKQYGTAIRIGSNYGSLSDRIVAKYGNTAVGMVEAAMEFINIFISERFYNIVVSMKASNTALMIQACRLLNARMLDMSMVFPQHLGVTEAGSDDEGRLKSAIGIGALLNDGIGDTIRVSLTEEPEKEIEYSKQIIKYNNNKSFRYRLPERTKITYNPYISLKKTENIIPNCNKFTIISEDDKSDYIYIDKVEDIKDKSKLYLTQYNIFNKIKGHSNITPIYSINELNTIGLLSNAPYFVSLNVLDIYNNLFKNIFKNNNIIPILEISTDNPQAEARFLYNELSKIKSNFSIILHYSCNSFSERDNITEMSLTLGSILIDNLISGLWISSPNTHIDIYNMCINLLQASGTLISKAEFISCPGCGRTSYNLQGLTQRVKQEFSSAKGLKIAVMGCVVNGLGEMADADYGFVGVGRNLLNIYKGQTAILKHVSEDEAIDKLKQILENFDR